MIDFPALPSGDKPVWDGERFQLGTQSLRVLAYSSNFSGWDDALTELHEIEAGDGQHPIDLASRSTAVDALRRYEFPADGAVLEIGCSSGFFLRDLKREFPNAQIVGTDTVVEPLKRLGESLRGIPLLQFDLLKCPLREKQFDAVVALNVLEHIQDDQTALERMAALLKAGGILVLEVPQGPGLYDYFDAYLRHFRRYDKKGLVAKVASAGLQPVKIDFLGSVSYPPFWVVKKLNRLRFGPRGEKTTRREELVRKQIKDTAKSKALAFAFSIEKALVQKLSLPFGIRCTVVARPTSAPISERSMPDITRFLKFALVGGATAVIYFLVLALNLEVLEVNYRLAVSAAYISSVLFHFVANKYFTFKSRTTRVLTQISKYLVLLLVNYFVTILVVGLIVEKVGLTAYHGVLASVPLIMVIGYLLSKHWVFKKSYIHG
jgi:putative flippase GtrA/SAM-dependent methyltransferase